MRRSSSTLNPESVIIFLKDDRSGRDATLDATKSGIEVGQKSYLIQNRYAGWEDVWCQDEQDGHTDESEAGRQRHSLLWLVLARSAIVVRQDRGDLH